VLSYEESVNEMARKDFNDFLMKTSRIVERALDQDFDVVGDFFADEDEDENEMKKRNKNDKIS